MESRAAIRIAKDFDENNAYWKSKHISLLEKIISKAII
jgi:hypothetical protein